MKHAVNGPVKSLMERPLFKRAAPWVGVLGLLVLLIVWFRHLGAVLAAQSIPFGFGFLSDASGFQISESLLPFDDTSSVAHALLVGLLNTLKVCVPAIVLSLLAGLLVGLGTTLRMSRLWAPLQLALQAYVNVVRGLPLLLQLMVWYFLITQALPEQAQILFPFEHVVLGKSGLFVPGYVWLGDGQGWVVELPDTSGFSVTGGWFFSPEWIALLAGLSTYTSAYIAEITRAGIESVSVAQTQAGLALGLRPLQVTRFIVMPQALRFMIPPATNQCLNLIKNSSLAVAIGYPELMSVANTTMNQTGRAVECTLIVMLVYLSLSLFTAWLSRRFNRRFSQQLLARGVLPDANRLSLAS